MKTTKSQKRIRRHNRLRAKMQGSAARPRVAIYKSNKFTYAQVIDDATGKTLIAVSDYAGKFGSKSRDLASGGKAKSAKGTKTEKAGSTGKALAEALQKKGIDTVVFDRGGFKYHGRVKALAESLRAAGIKF